MNVQSGLRRTVAQWMKEGYEFAESTEAALCTVVTHQQPFRIVSAIHIGSVDELLARFDEVLLFTEEARVITAGHYRDDDFFPFFFIPKPAMKDLKTAHKQIQEAREAMQVATKSFCNVMARERFSELSAAGEFEVYVLPSEADQLAFVKGARPKTCLYRLFGTSGELDAYIKGLATGSSAGNSEAHSIDDFIRAAEQKAFGQGLADGDGYIWPQSITTQSGEEFWRIAQVMKG